jgi:Family of unknown function (DUF5684)
VGILDVGAPVGSTGTAPGDAPVRAKAAPVLSVVTGILASSSADVVVIVVLLAIVLGVVELAGLWKVFTKAQERGWAVLIPFYNYWCVLRIVGRPGWWLLLYFIPIVNIVIGIVVLWDLVKSFEKSAGWFVGLLLLPFVFYPMIGFGDSRYAGPAGPERWGHHQVAV